MGILFRRIAFAVLTLVIAGCASSPTPVPPTLTATQARQANTPAPTVARPTPTGISPEKAGAGAIHPAQPMLAERATHAATLLLDGRVLITGGFGRGEDAYEDSAELYDPASRSFVSTGKMAIRRCCHSATRLLDGRVLIAGGFNGEYLSGAEIYNPASGEFTPASSLTSPRMDHIAVLLDDGRVLLAGGVGTGWTFLSSAEIYDPATGSFSITGKMTVPRHKHDAVLLGDGRVLITGGSDESDDQGAYSSAEVYDPARGVFSRISNMPTARYKHIGTSLLLMNGNALIAGGAREAVIYNPEQDVFHIVAGELGSATLSRLFSTATLLRNGEALITGGYGVSQNVSAGAWIYTP